MEAAIAPPRAALLMAGPLCTTGSGCSKIGCCGDWALRDWHPELLRCTRKKLYVSLKPYLESDFMERQYGSEWHSHLHYYLHPPDEKA